jgi:ketosteroid isomerase-like protein
MLLLTLGKLAAADEAVHEELRTLRTEIIDAITRGDIDSVIKHVHPDAVVTWQNSEVCRGQKGLKDFFERMGKDSFKGYKIPPTPDELTILHGGNTGVSFGETVAEYRLLGKGYELKSRWTATLVKENGKWLLAAYHISMNVLDNPILSTARQGLYLGAAVALVIGILIGRMLVKRPGSNHQPPA